MARRKAKRKPSKLVRTSPSQPTFGDALREMRSTAHEGVQEAISRAVVHSPPKRAKGTPRVSHGHKAQTLFAGLVEGMAEAIVENATPGAEVMMAKLVAEMLISRVHANMCAGSC